MEHALNWQKSTFSGGGEGNTCVEVATTPTAVHLRESDTPATELTTGTVPLAHLIRGLKSGTAVNWQKSTFSDGGDGNTCVEVAATPTAVHLRESDTPAVELTTGTTPLAHLIRGLKSGSAVRVRVCPGATPR
ncbi:DUF397 domain-containing protein [Streptomyces sp. NPDC087903]|uniref:DUF397 domain-containing protein n=1 Tax=Streptomyces sp. NPDC087903 TaxID=3365819 RepID=UPI0038016102